MSGSRNSDAPLILGIDVGTSSIKAAVFEANAARAIAVARRRSRVSSPRRGWSEADPHAMLSAVFDCIRDVVQDLEPNRVAAIGISGTACGAWLLSDDRALVRPPILWNDGRAADIVDEWAGRGFGRTVFARTGNVLFSGFTLPTVAWLHRHEPESIAQATTLLFCKDWIRAALTGRIGTDVTDASYVPFDVRSRRWNTALWDEAGIGDAARLLPEILPDDDTAPLLDARAAELGLRPGIPVAVGATDIVAGMVGGGALEPGRGVTILGTSANSSMVTAEPDFTPPNVGILAAGPLQYSTRTMVNTSGTTTLEWAASILAGGDLGRLLSLAESAPADGDRPVLVPYLSATGTVSPVPDPKARATFAGLRADHTPADLARAAVEGLAFAVADTIACMTDTPEQITAVGGAARSSLLLRAIADAAGVRVIHPVGDEFGARGVALLAARSAGILSDADFFASADDITVDAVFEPSSASRLDRYRSTRDAASTLWATW